MDDNTKLALRLAAAQDREDEKRRRLENCRQLNKAAKKGGILFTGSSLMEQFPVCEMSMNEGIKVPIYNRGVGGTTSEEFLKNIEAVLTELEPAAAFINIGTNDLNSSDVPAEELIAKLRENYIRIAERCRTEIPETEIYIMAFYPVHEGFRKRGALYEKDFAGRRNSVIEKANHMLEAFAAEYRFHFIPAAGELYDDSGMLRKELTCDGVHMYADAYRIVFENIKPILRRAIRSTP